MARSESRAEAPAAGSKWTTAFRTDSSSLTTAIMRDAPYTGVATRLPQLEASGYGTLDLFRVGAPR